MNWSSIPLPLKIAIAVISSLVLLILATKMHSLVVIAAVVAWVVVLGSLFHSAGLINGVERIPYVGGLIVNISLPNNTNIISSKKNPHDPTPLKGHSETALKPKDKKTLLEEAESKLRKLKLIEPTINRIFEDIIDPAKIRIDLKKHPLGEKRAWITVIYGPPGVGKTSIMEALSDILVGLNAVEDNKLSPIGKAVPGQIETNWVQALTAGVNGIVIADNARWMEDDYSYDQSSKNSEAFLETVSALALKSHGKLTIIITMTDMQYENAFVKNSKIAEIKGDFTFNTIECEPLTRESLYEVFLKKIEAKQLYFDQNAKTRMLKIIETAMKDIKKFKNIKTMDEWADELDVRLHKFKKNTISKEDLDWLQEKISGN